MIRWDTALMMAVVTVAGPAGCSSKAALPKKTSPEARPAQAVPAQQSERAAKSGARDSAFSTYSNPQYGVSFRYPRNFALLEYEAPEEADATEVEQDLEAGTLEPNSIIQSWEELQNEEPGAVLLTTLIVPDDAYPNTSFAGGAVQFAVNRYQTARSCRANLLARLGDSKGVSGDVTIQGVVFGWIDNDEGNAGTEFFERDYSGFVNETCYEFFLRVGVDAAADPEDEVRAPDEKKILLRMEKIVSSLQFESKAVSALDAAPSGQASRPRR